MNFFSGKLNVLMLSFITLTQIGCKNRPQTDTANAEVKSMSQESYNSVREKFGKTNESLAITDDSFKPFVNWNCRKVFSDPRLKAYDGESIYFSRSADQKVRLFVRSTYQPNPQTLEIKQIVNLVGYDAPNTEMGNIRKLAEASSTYLIMEVVPYPSPNSRANDQNGNTKPLTSGYGPTHIVKYYRICEKS